MTSGRSVLVASGRLPRWFANFSTRHGPAEYAVQAGRLVCRALDGAVAEAALPFGGKYAADPDVESFQEAVEAPIRWGLLLVRKGGFALAALDGATINGSKVGQRHVQGRTKAGGQSQQRFARRRENQARVAYEAAAEHAHQVLVVASGPLEALVCGGDRQAVDAVLSDPRLRRLAAVRTGPWLAVPDPRRSVLDQAVIDARSAPDRGHRPRPDLTRRVAASAPQTLPSCRVRTLESRRVGASAPQTPAELARPHLRVGSDPGFCVPP